MKFASDKPMTNLLLVACLALTAMLAAEWLMPFKLVAVDAGQSGAALVDESPTGAQSRYVHPHIGDFPEVLARPIFFSNRELPRKAVVSAPAPGAPLRLKLEGIAIAADIRVAVLRDQGSNQLVQMSVGMTHNNWLLEDLTSAHAVFRRDDDIAELTLDIENR